MSAPMPDPEAAFVGALLHLPPADVLAALDLMTAEDFADLRMEVVLTACRQLAEVGVTPDPVAVLAHVRQHALVTGVEAVRSFHLFLLELHASCPVPASWRYYAAAALAESLRRRCAELGVRMAQAAENAPLDALVEVLDAECRAVRAVLNRRAVAVGDAPMRLRGVTAA